MDPARILIVEDEELMRSILRQLLTGAGYQVFTADSAESGLKVFSDTDIDATLTDIKMAGRDGIELLGQIRRIDDAAMVIVLTAFSSLETAVSALRNGAFDYVTKPFNNEDLLRRVANAVTQRRLVTENALLRRQIAKQNDATDLIGTSPSIGRVMTMIDRVAPTDSTILITGETGTGKELVARSIHAKSGRGDKPFVAVNCSAIPDGLIESELFGHEKGSFTGAISTEQGILRSAAGGTILLDEIGELPESAQVKLLRVLQEREVTPVGSDRAFRFDARVLAATNRDLAEMVKHGTFREDLYFRINVIEIEVPPLRERRDDIMLLAKYFLSRICSRSNRSKPDFSAEVIAAFEKHEWPGNIRELENAIERAAILADDVITIDHLTKSFSYGSSKISNREDRTLDTLERNHIERILAEVDGDKPAAAAILGIDLSTLYRKLKRRDGGDHSAENSIT